ncbi:Arc family DNA-binding protein [Burkholderia metallica]|uniref:Arc family DNA-binding protein n=1 Tax=Burkholderia metallica TaxID=488729 RepID=UPI001CF1E39D|nr:Arc family DNA-binding protein [Burkholderia metallica]MCA8003144.1 Arc family DNA-binding protein [Burkholderia metallica]
MARDEPQTNLRIPAALKERLVDASVKSKRSLTAEIVARLEESFASDGVSSRSVDDRTMDLFADTVAGKVVQALDEREKLHKR